MLNANQLLKKIQNDPIMEGVNHKKLTDLLNGTKGKFNKKQIQHIRKAIREGISQYDAVLSKLENQ